MAVSPGDDTPIQERNAAAVVLVANQPSRCLHQPQRGFRHGHFEERISALALEHFRYRFVHRIVRRGEGQFGEDDVSAVVAGQVHALGEARKAENVALLAGVDRPTMLVQKALLGRRILQVASLAEIVRQRRHDGVELPPRGEQHQGAAFQGEQRRQARG